MSDKLTLEQAQALIGAEVAFLISGHEVVRGIVKAAGPDEEDDIMLENTDGVRSWPGYGSHGFRVIAPAPAPTNTSETLAARVARLRTELEQAQTELDAVSPAFPSGWSMRDGSAHGSDGEEIRLRGSVLLIDDRDGDQVAIDPDAMRAFLARLG
jgi:hypothetical protein